MTIAYIISAYKLPALLVRLVRRLDGPHTSFYIHVDAKASEDVHYRMEQPLADRPNVQFLERHACAWGDFGHVLATLKGLWTAFDSENSPDYAVLLTGQDYPLVSNDEIKARLEAADGQIFMEYFSLPSDRWTDGGMDRIEHRQIRVAGRYLRVPGQPFAAPLLAGLWRVATKLLLRPFPDGLAPYGGSSYWIMPRECARYVLDFAQSNPHVLRFFEQTAVPDEMFFQTIVLNSPWRDAVVNNDLRFIDWSDDEGSPAVLTLDRFDELMASGKPFARKFDPTVDAAVLDRIDEALDAKATAGTEARR